LPVFPAAHFAKVAKLALSGFKQGNFYAPLAGKNFGHLTMSRRKTAPAADFRATQKTYRTLLTICMLIMVKKTIILLWKPLLFE